MAGVKGRSGAILDKPYREALRMEIAAAGENHKLLRRIARAHLELAKGGDMQAIKEMADRLDGKPAQEQNITVTRVRATELPDDELADIATGGSEGTASPPLDPSQLN